MEKLRLFLVVSFFALLAAACGGGGSSSTSSTETPAQPVTLSLSELSATVEISTTHQFSATVENADDTTVDWQVNKVTGGSSTVGTVSDSGLYTAPDHVPSPITVTVTAVAHADATQEASATVTIMSNVTVAVSPGDTTIPAGETLQLTAAIENAKDTAARWKVNEVAGGNATLGTISSGLYTAPALPPPGGSVTITAISLADTSKTDSVNVTVQFSNASLNGPYVFGVSGNTPGLGQYYAAGRFVADGKGNIVSGTEDLRQTDGVSAQLSLTGTYGIVPERNGGGTLTLNVEGFADPVIYRFVLTSSGEGPLRADTPSAGSGQMYKQDPDSFSNASMNGSYVFQYLGAGRPDTVASVGLLTCDGSGNINAATMDINDDGTLLTKVPVSGSYSVEATGRTVLTLTLSFGTESPTVQLTAYLISTDRAELTALREGGFSAGLGMAEKQQLTNFSNASLSGDYVFSANGDPPTEPNSMLARFTANGAGTLNAGVADVFADFNNVGILTQNAAFTGTYSVPATDHGRGLLNLITSDGTEGAIFYVVSEKKAFMLGTSTYEATAGQMVAQQGAPFSVSSLKGDFVFSLRGFNTTLEVDATGALYPDGSGALSGRKASNVGGIVTSVPVTGTYSVDTNGRGQAMISDGTTESTFNLYVVDSSHALLLENDWEVTKTITFGSMEAQF